MFIECMVILIVYIDVYIFNIYMVLEVNDWYKSAFNIEISIFTFKDFHVQMHFYEFVIAIIEHNKVVATERVYIAKNAWQLQQLQ